MLESFKRATNAVVNLVNRAGVNNSRAVSALAAQEERLSFLAAVHRCASLGFSLGTLSEASLRISKTRFLTLPNGLSFPQADKNDVAVYDLNANSFINRVESPLNLEIHKLIYKSSAHKATLLCHPKWAFRLFSRGADLDYSSFPILESKIGQLAVSKVEDLEQLISTHTVFFIPNIGILSLGETLDQALERIELLEWISWQNQS